MKRDVPYHFGRLCQVMDEEIWTCEVGVGV
jgi:hypothetical protein